MIVETKGTNGAAKIVPAALPRRMSFSAATFGKVIAPDRMLVYGEPGTGKTTFAAGAENPVFLAPEEGSNQQDGIARLPRPLCWQDMLDGIDELVTADHDRKTLVIDTLDKAESLLHNHICERDRQPNIEAYGYGKGYIVALKEWGTFINELERLRRTRGMDIILIAHGHKVLFKNVTGSDYERIDTKLHPKAGGLFKEWCDSILYAYREVITQDLDGKIKAIDVGAHLMSTRRAATWDAKSRYDLPATMPLSFAEYAGAKKAYMDRSADVLRKSILDKCETIADAELKAKIVETTTAAGNNVSRLIEIENRVNARLSAAKGA